MILNGSTDNGFVSQQLINIAFGLSLTFGVLLKGLVLKEFHNPELIKRSLKDWLVSNSRRSSSLSNSISIEINFLLSPLLIDLIIPDPGDVNETPIFFLSSNIFSPPLTWSPSLNSIVGFIPTKSLDKSATLETFGSSEIFKDGDPEIGKSRPFEILITFFSVPLQS